MVTVNGDRLKKLRKDLHLSRSELAKKLNISISAIGMYERGERTPKDNVKIKYARLLNKTVDEIFFTKE